MKSPFFSLRSMLLIICCLGHGYMSLAQLTTQSTSPLTAYGSGSNMRLVDMPPVPQDLDHSIYLDEGWAPGDILLENNRIIRECTLRYDIANGYLEVQSETGIRATPEKEVEQFFMVEGDNKRWFVSGLLFTYDKGPLSTLMEVLVDDDTQLLFSSRIIITQPNGGFTEQRRAGADAITSMQEDKYYLTEGEELIDASTKKKMLAAFGEYQEDMKAWAKANKIKYNDQDDVIALVQQYNAITKN